MDRPILFSAPMVRALLAGTKTQTRRLIPSATQDAYYEYDDWCRSVSAGIPTSRQWEVEYFLERSRIQVGDRLWVREAFSYETLDVDRDGFMAPWYWADGNPDSGDFTRPKPSIHMPRWASRLTLTVTDVRVQRLQDISEEDAEAEGALIEYGEGASISERRAFNLIWEHINGTGSWEQNPWVAAYTFTVERRNIDAPAPSRSSSVEG